MSSAYGAEAESGYLHRGYAASLVEFGTPRFLPQCAGWILERVVPCSTARDGMGCYPLFTCRNWAQLQSDLDRLEGDLTCLSLVTDPFGDYSPADLQRCFKDVARPFKEHFVVDLSRAPTDFVHPHHQRSARKALERLQIERCAEPALFLDEWIQLYSTLVERHKIKGLPAFSRRAFSHQLDVPGLVMLRATHDGHSVGMTLWYTREKIGYYHLGAYSQEGYELSASFALFRYALDYFGTSNLRWLNLGAGAGLKRGAEDGLARFKRGWATGTRMAYFCGRIFNRRQYAEIVRARGINPTSYFPLYRAGEFGH